MQIVIVVIELEIIAGMFALGLFIKNFFPSYMDKKGENLATKEDIAENISRCHMMKKKLWMEFLGYDKSQHSQGI